ncbi:MAG: 16S rRNA (guanine(966)-N(2))-methyltransferase RsmD [Dehalococcoidia bacterium]|nr:16S rRNA (guanine(966)-N(2))-methyltransferase RsmD [Dehalococcoidia bacterium]
MSIPYNASSELIPQLHKGLFSTSTSLIYLTQSLANLVYNIIMGMRIIAGSVKGFPLKVPRGTPTRPATELVRGAIFSILTSSVDDWSKVLDLFSGSGSLGIEALSRGAGKVDFIDQEARCCAIIKENLTKTGFNDKAKVHCLTVSRAIAVLEGPYNIILIDPPYKDTGIGKTIEQLANSSLISMETVVVITHSSRFKLEMRYGPLVLKREYRHGDSTIAIFRRESLP